MKKVIGLHCLLATLFLVSCNDAAKKEPADSTTPSEKADAIYAGGDIITMDGDIATYVEALAVKNGKIIYAGNKAGADRLKGDSTTTKDLNGKTLLPGFIDPHSHFINALSMTTQANCFAPPVGTAADAAGIIASLKELQTRNKIGKGEMIMGYGYDENQMPKGGLLNRDDLDKAFPDNPVMAGHVSLHGAVIRVDVLKIKDIRVAETIKEGKTIYKK